MKTQLSKIKELKQKYIYNTKQKYYNVSKLKENYIPEDQCTIKERLSKLKENYLPEDQCKCIYEWIHTNKYLADDGEGKKVFCNTYKKDELPEFLKYNIKGIFNVYHFIFIISVERGYIAPHVDDDLYETCRNNLDICIPEKQPWLPPETEVYYVDACPEMKGGEIVMDNIMYAPKRNSSITIPIGKLHSVTSITHQKRFRTAVVCEKYFLPKKYLDLLQTPLYNNS
tara:strand:- start:887 stop:1567 length:681 start_codon:yes stop_codon:yes gene_type:complete